MHYDCDLDVIRTSYPAQSTSRIYAEIAKDVSALWRQPELFDRVEAVLRKSEDDKSFVIEENILICNAKVSDIDRPVHMLYRLSESIHFEDRPINLVFVLLSPVEDGPFHLRRLSRLTRLLGDSVFCKKLHQSDDKDSIRAQFMYPELSEQVA